MKLEEVIQLGKEAEKTMDIHWFSSPWWVWLIVAVTIFTFVIVTVSNVKSDYFDGDSYWFPMTITVIAGICFMATIDIDTHDGITPWRDEIAKSYIESLPVERKEVVFIKIDPELSHKVYGDSFFGTGYTRSSAVERTPLVVSYKDNGIATRTDWYETHMELTNEDNPYIEFQRLTKNLGHDVNAGLYNVKVHLPESYKFTDIK